MTRKVFIADVATMATATISGVSKFVKGAEDGELDFCYTPSSGVPVNIHMIATDVSGYPSENTFMLYTESETAPNVVNDVLSRVANFSAGSVLRELIPQIVSELHRALAGGSRDDPFSLEDDQMALDFHNIEDESDDDSMGDPNDWQDPVPGDNSFGRIAPESAVKLNQRIRHDLRTVRQAGFKIGILSGMKAESQMSFLSISIEVSRLGLSEEAIQAWDLDIQQHVVLLIRYSAGYKTFEAIISEAPRMHEVEFRVGISNRYKPTLTEALAAFTAISKKDINDSGDVAQEDSRNQKSDSLAGFNGLFISSSLNEYMNEQFTSLLKIRHSKNSNWDEAKRHYGNQQGRMGDYQPVAHSSSETENSEPVGSSNVIPEFLALDHFQDSDDEMLSFPLIAIQFCMRYLTRCTEFCLVCHDKIEDSFEALKPYVCSKPLCLYQYMALGFGPSVEHEILTQPYVVDLLISFCYVSVKSRRIRDYPTGMSLSVPPVTIPENFSYASYGFIHSPAPSPQTSVNGPGDTCDSYKVKYDHVHQEITFDKDKPCPLHRGDWIVLTATNKLPTHHRVIAVAHPIVKVSIGIVSPPGGATNTVQMQNPGANISQASTTAPADTPTLSTVSSVELTVYDQNFDDLTTHKKAESMIVLLETIPSVKEMRNYLKQQKHISEPSLRTWTERISPAALGLLRWIIASNRSCIVQVDLGPSQEDDDTLMTSNTKQDEKVSNMDGWVQFRFAQGAPDKEHRFKKALEDTNGKRNLDYPTLFAWHGSGLQNWHSIIRSGLDFKDTLNGRACGHGCYHSLEYSTSVGYSQMHSVGAIWPSSELKITSAMCLNEIVNVPQDFVCRTPHLVVQHLDWIQCRYLFVRNTSDTLQGSSTTKPGLEERPRNVAEIELDKEFMPKGVNQKPIGIPRNAFPASREFRLKTPSKHRFSSIIRKNPTRKEYEVEGDHEDQEDIDFLYSDNDDSELKIEKGNEKGKFKGKGKRVEDVTTPDSEPRKRTKSMTDFVPGLLNQSTLQILSPPAYATSMATKALTRELKATLKVQDSSLLHELGWYIDKNMVQNVYQWIVELHSFDPDLPLSKDMKAAGIKSVVLEIRFGKDFPMSPPFVRVIRPRFLPFMLGGGGHVTGGGAMCMELLTNSGWSSVSSIESVLLQVRMAIANLEPKPARLEIQGKQQQRDYGVAEAMEAYVRACRTHGWEIPKDFKDFASAGGNGFGY